MAKERISLRKVKHNFRNIEETYFTTAAHFKLLLNGVKNPSQEEILEYKKYLKHIYLGLYILLDKPLTERQMDILYRASCGEEISETAKHLNISVNRVLEIQTEVIKNLNAKNAKQALYKATSSEQLPAYGKEPPILKNRITEGLKISALN